MSKEKIALIALVLIILAVVSLPLAWVVDVYLFDSASIMIYVMAIFSFSSLILDLVYIFSKNKSKKNTILSIIGIIVSLILLAISYIIIVLSSALSGGG